MPAVARSHRLHRRAVPGGLRVWGLEPLDGVRQPLRPGKAVPPPDGRGGEAGVPGRECGRAVPGGLRTGVQAPAGDREREGGEEEEDLEADDDRTARSVRCRHLLLARRELVAKEFGKLNSLPPPGSTLLHSPIYVNDLMAAVAKHLGVDAELAFNNTLEPLLRKWVTERVPSARNKEVVLCKAQLDELEGRAKWADADDDTACTDVKALLEPCASAIRATAQAFKSEEQMQELHAIVKAGDKVYLGIYAGMHKQVRCCFYTAAATAAAAAATAALFLLLHHGSHPTHEPCPRAAARR